MSERNVQPGEEHPAGLQDVSHPHSTGLPHTGVSYAIDRFLTVLGGATSWLWLAVVGVILVSVISRYVFSSGSVALEEAGWHISSFVWLIGLAYTAVYDQHVRVDVIHERMKLKTQAWFELFGLIFLLLPFAVIVAYYGMFYGYESFLIGETSQAPSGLPYRWFLKGMMAVAMVLLALAGLARLLRVTAFLFGAPKPRPAR